MKHKFLPALLCCCLLLCGTAVQAFAMSAAPGTLYSGIDVSEYQGSIDFAEVKNSGYEVVYIRAGWGDNNTDPYFEQNYINAFAAGMKVGFYYYVTAATPAQAKTQAQYFGNLLAHKNYDGHPAMDFEEFGSLSDTEIRAVALAFLQELQAVTGAVPMIYSDASSAASLWGADFADYPLWVADYNGGAPTDSPVWSEWTAYQYGNSSGVAGIDDEVDLDSFTDGAFLSGDEIKSVNRQRVANGVPSVSHVIRPGESFWAIATRYGINPYFLAATNNLCIFQVIYTGEPLEVYLKEELGVNLVAYTVRRGDTLWALSRKYGSCIANLAGYNHISNPNLIFVNQELLIPVAPGETAAK